jgi:hypothetical protein
MKKTQEGNEEDLDAIQTEDNEDGIDESSIQRMQPTAAFVERVNGFKLEEIIKEVFDAEVANGSAPFPDAKRGIVGADKFETCREIAWGMIKGWVKDRRKAALKYARKLNDAGTHQIPQELLKDQAGRPSKKRKISETEDDMRQAMEEAADKLFEWEEHGFD